MSLWKWRHANYWFQWTTKILTTLTLTHHSFRTIWPNSVIILAKFMKNSCAIWIYFFEFSGYRHFNCILLKLFQRDLYLRQWFLHVEATRQWWRFRLETRKAGHTDTGYRTSCWSLNSLGSRWDSFVEYSTIDKYSYWQNFARSM